MLAERDFHEVQNAATSAQIFAPQESVQTFCGPHPYLFLPHPEVRDDRLDSETLTLLELSRKVQER